MLTISNGQVKQGKVKTHLSLTIKLKKIKGHFFPLNVTLNQSEKRNILMNCSK